MRTTLTTAAVLAAGALLGWLAASGQLVPWAHAEEKQPASGKGGAGLSPILPPPDAPFDGIIGRTYKDSNPRRSRSRKPRPMRRTCSSS
jgi:hypothetical protein